MLLTVSWKVFQVFSNVHDNLRLAVHYNCSKPKGIFVVYVSLKIVFELFRALGENPKHRLRQIAANRTHLAFRIDDESATKPERLWGKGEKLLEMKVRL